MSEDKKHELIQDLKRVRAELGRNPTRREYRELGALGHSYETQFGLWSQFVIAAGLPYEKEAKEKKVSSSELFKASIDKHISNYWDNISVSPSIIRPDFKDSVIIGDCHFPFTCFHSVNKIYEFIEREQPKRAIQIGDLRDRYGSARFTRSLNVYTPREEDRLATEMSTDFWRKIQKLVPGIECYQIIGNHDIRPIARIMDHYPEGEDMVTEMFRALYTFENVTTIYDPREPLVLGNTMYMHGNLSKLGDHRDYNLSNVVCGHSHTGGVVFRNVFDPMTMKQRVLAEANAGYIGDPTSKALGYTPQKYGKWTKGFLTQDKYNHFCFRPIFV